MGDLSFAFDPDGVAANSDAASSALAAAATASDAASSALAKAAGASSALEDVVDKKHTQNTDTGTTQTSFQIDSGNSGPKLKNSSGEVQIRNAADGADANLKAAILTLSGGQLVFPASQNASAGANTLDDYEEGTWTPYLTFGGAAVGMTCATRSGYYTKVGNLVFVHGEIKLSAKGSSSGDASITALPFSAGATINNGKGMILPESGMASLTAGGAIYISTWNTSAIPRILSTTGRASLTEANFTNSSHFVFSLIYRAA